MKSQTDVKLHPKSLDEKKSGKTKSCRPQSDPVAVKKSKGVHEKGHCTIKYRPFGRLNPTTYTPFYEQAIVDGKLCFITVDREGKIGIASEITTIENGQEVIIRPRQNLPYRDYVVKKEWLEHPEQCFTGEHWSRVKQISSEYTDFTAPKEHSALSVAIIVLSYIADLIFQSVPYFFALGDPKSGKSHWGRMMSRFMLRPLYSESLPVADIYEFLTNGGKVIIEDEAQGLEYDAQKMKIYKGGYTAGSKVARILAGNHGEREQVFYDSYGVKIFISEELVDDRGFMRRCIIITMVYGHPRKDEPDPADEPVIEEIRGRLLALRVNVAAGNIQLPEFKSDEPWFKNEKELYKPLLTVAPETDRQPIIESARRRFEEERAELAGCIEAQTVIAYVMAVRDLNTQEVTAEEINDRLKDLPNPWGWTYNTRSTGMRLSKLDFGNKQARRGNKRLSLRSVDPSILRRLVRKYDLADRIKEEGLEGTLKGLYGPDGPDSVDKALEDTKDSKITAFCAETDGKNIQAEPVSTVSTVRTTEPPIDPKREDLIQILRSRDSWSSCDEAVNHLVGLGYDRDSAMHDVNRLIGDGLFALDPDGCWRLMK
jgi:hypothetical protein